MEEEKQFLTPQQVADMLQVNIKTVRRAIHRKELKAVRFGTTGQFRIQRSDLQSFLEQSTHPNSPQ